jgi:hypothetical protein
MYKISSPPELEPQKIQPVAKRYTNYAIPVPEITDYSKYAILF